MPSQFICGTPSAEKKIREETELVYLLFSLLLFHSQTACMNDFQKGNERTKFQNSSLLFLTVPQITLLIVVVLLLVMMVSVCTQFTKGPVSTKALLLQLQNLQRKFALGKTVNPETERETMEQLQNKIKTSSDPALISGDANLRRLLFSNCRSIQTILGEPDLANRTAWIKLNALMVDFDTQYFRN